jgi:hypothetical protein
MIVRVTKCKAGFSMAFALTATVLTWLVLGDNSPLESYFLEHVTVPNVFRAMLTIPYLIQVILRPSNFAYVIGYGFIFLQWLLVGYLLSLLVCRRTTGRLSLQE